MSVGLTPIIYFLSERIFWGFLGGEISFGKRRMIIMKNIKIGVFHFEIFAFFDFLSISHQRFRSFRLNLRREESKLGQKQQTEFCLIKKIYIGGFQMQSTRKK